MQPVGRGSVRAEQSRIYLSLKEERAMSIIDKTLQKLNRDERKT